MRSAFSNTTTVWPARASCCAQASPAGPEPTTATRRPVFAAGGLRCDPAVFPRLVGDRVLDRLDADRVVVDVERARRLARRRAHASGELREIVGRVQRLDRALPVLLVNEVVPVRNDVVDRAAAHAERRAAIHAARALHAGLLVGEPRDEFAPVPDAFLRRLVRFCQPLELHESRDLPHNPASMNFHEPPSAGRATMPAAASRS